MSSETMPNWLAKRADLTPKRIAIENEEEKMTFKELNEQAKIMARQVASLDIEDEENIALLLKNDFPAIILIHALAYLDVTLVFLNTRLSPKELAFQVQDAGVKRLIYADNYEELVVKINLACQQEKVNLKFKLETISIKQLSTLKEMEIPLQTEINLAKIHSIIYTSGTTGTPKGVTLSYGNHFWSAVGSCLNLGLDNNDTWLLALPIFHVSGLSILMRSVIYGIRIVVHENFEAQKVNQSLLNHGVTLISVVSIQLQKMLDNLKQDSYPSSLRCVLLGGGFVPRSLLEESQKRKIPVFQTYGMTETASQIVTLSPEYLTSKLGSAGKPLFPAQLKIMSKDQEIINEVGEIVVKGPSVTKGYYHNEKATKEAFKEGWIYTGDLGYVDEEGFLYIVDRRSDLIISGGENIYPAEIETVLLTHPDVEEVGVTGMDDEKWGKVPIAFIKVKESKNRKNNQAIIDNKNNEDIKYFKDTKLLAHQLQHYCGERLAKYKVPTRIIFVESLPRNASNKLLRRKLLEYLN